MVPLSLHLALTPASAFVFDRIERAHTSMSTASFTATSNLSGVGAPTSTKLEVKYRWPNEFRIRHINPKTNVVLLDRVIEPTRVIEYDPALMQYTSKARQSGQTTGAILAQLDEGLDDLILAFSTEKGFGVWIGPLVQNQPWTVSKSGSNASLSFAKDKRRISLLADSSTGRLTKVDITTGPQRLVWNLRYADRVAGLAFAPPPGAVEVPIFDRESKPPQFKDATARRVANKLFAAYADLSSLGYNVLRGEEKTVVQLRGRFARQDDPVASWTYDGKTLIVHVKQTNKWYRGDMGFPDVVDAVGGLGTRVDPTLRLLMTGFNPYRRRLGDGAMVKAVGSMEIRGVPVTILESENENAIITLFVRDSDGKVVNSSTRAKETASIDDQTVDLRYEYFEVPRDLATSGRLVAPRGTTPIKLTPKKIN